MHLKGKKCFLQAKCTIYHVILLSAGRWCCDISRNREPASSTQRACQQTSSTFYFHSGLFHLFYYFSSLLFCFQLQLSEQVGQFYFCLFGLAQSWQAELNSKPKSFHWKKSYSWHYSPQCRIFLCLQNLPLGPKLVLQPPFNSSLEFLSVDTPETQPKQPLRVTSAPIFNLSFYFISLA